MHDFKGEPDDGAFPEAGLTPYNGSLYGTTESGGESPECSVDKDVGCGVAFELSSSGSVWKETILHSFSGAWDGAFPQGLIYNSDGSAFAVAQAGGAVSDSGVAFELTPAPK